MSGSTRTRGDEDPYCLSRMRQECCGRPRSFRRRAEAVKLNSSRETFYLWILPSTSILRISHKPYARNLSDIRSRLSSNPESSQSGAGTIASSNSFLSAGPEKKHEDENCVTRLGALAQLRSASRV